MVTIHNNWVKPASTCDDIVNSIQKRSSSKLVESHQLEIFLLPTMTCFCNSKRDRIHSFSGRKYDVALQFATNISRQHLALMDLLGKKWILLPVQAEERRIIGVKSIVDF